MNEQKEQGTKGEAGIRPELQPMLSLVIVLYNSKEYIGPCLSALGRVTYRPLELILVDNGSEDGSAEAAREAAGEAGIVECTVSLLGGNRGFAAANNEGFRLSRGHIMLMLNPDTEIAADAPAVLVEALRRPGVGIAGCKLLYPDGLTIQHAGGFIRDNGLTMHYGFEEEDRGLHDELRDVHYVTGAALAVRRDVFRRVGLLDEGYYPAYFEETDLCLKVRRLGYRVVYAPGARVIHHESTTTGRFTKRYYYLYHRNRVRFMLKNYSWRFLLDRALPFEQRWLEMIAPWEQALPLNRAYLANLWHLPGTLAARWKTERMLGAVPRVEDTVSEF